MPRPTDGDSKPAFTKAGGVGAPAPILMEIGAEAVTAPRLSIAIAVSVYVSFVPEDQVAENGDEVSEAISF